MSSIKQVEAANDRKDGFLAHVTEISISEEKNTVDCLRSKEPDSHTLAPDSISSEIPNRIFPNFINITVIKSARPF